MEILAPFQPRIKGGGVITVVVASPGQAVFWDLVGIDPDTGAEIPAMGMLRWPVSLADQASRAVNVWIAPRHNQGEPFTCGDGVYCGTGKTTGGTWLIYNTERMKAAAGEN